MKQDIEVFEAKKIRQLPQTMDDSDIMLVWFPINKWFVTIIYYRDNEHGGLATGTHAEGIEMIKPRSNDAYISKIKKKLNEDHLAREEREKRRRKILVDQMKAHEAQEVVKKKF